MCRWQKQANVLLYKEIQSLFNYMLLDTADGQKFDAPPAVLPACKKVQEMSKVAEFISSPESMKMTEIEQARLELIEALERSMKAKIKVLEHELTPKEYKSTFNALHAIRIELLIAKGEIPEPKKGKPRFRNGLYV